MYQVSLRPYYDSIHQCYKQVVEIFPKPTGALAQIIKQVKPLPLSPFRKFGDCDYASQERCVYVILNPNNYCDFLTIEELPILLCFLSDNEYRIDNQITKIMMKSNTTIKETLLFYIIDSKK
jgi:hypothetical protein